MYWTENYGEANPKKCDNFFSLPVHIKYEFGAKEKEGLLNQNGDWPQKGESPKQGQQCLSKQYPWKVLAGRLSILTIRPVFPVVQVFITRPIKHLNHPVILFVLILCLLYPPRITMFIQWTEDIGHADSLCGSFLSHYTIINSYSSLSVHLANEQTLMLNKVTG